MGRPMSELPAIQNQINRYTDAVNRHDWSVFPAIYATDATWYGLGLKLKFEGIEAITKGRSGVTFDRGWENWCNRVGRPYGAREWVAGERFSRTDGNFR